MNIQVKGGQVLSGEIHPSGSKNSAVALIPATVLLTETVTLENVPEITDVVRLVDILKKMGSRIEWTKEKKTMTINNSDLSFKDLDKTDLGNMRGTSLLWGSMLARFGKVDFEDLPGGCTLGVRSLDPQYKAFRDLGVKIEESYDSVKMDARGAVPGTIWLTEMSPTITENIMMLATSLPGITKIIGAASEPQVQDVCQFLIAAGAHITGIGSSILEIEGGFPLKGLTHKIFSDHYEITTFLALGAVTGGGIRVYDALPDLMPNIINVFSRFSIDVDYEGTTAVVKKDQTPHIQEEKGKTLVIKAQPWPALPVDLLPIFIPLGLAAKEGQILYHNWMYEAGLFWTSELLKLGAGIIMADPHRVIVTSGNKLHGAKLEAPYIIRAVVAMVMASMIAEGETTILNADALYRGHPHFSENLRKLGAEIEEI